MSIPIEIINDLRMALRKDGFPNIESLTNTELQEIAAFVLTLYKIEFITLRERDMLQSEYV